jgi:hypothetical protein
VPRLNPKLRKSLIASHRFFGQLTAAVVVVLALTGLAMNHEEDLEFLKGTVRWEPLLDWYGLAPEGELLYFAADPHSGASLERGIYLNGRYLVTSETPLVGVTRFQRFLALATRDRLLLVDPELVDPEVVNPSPSITHESTHESSGGRAQILDQMDSASLPGPLTRVGRSSDEELVVDTDSGSYKADADLLSWSATELTAVDWSVASSPPKELRGAILREFRGEGLPRTRVIADLHSGRILGDYGPWLMDGSALIFLLLVASGIVGSGLGRRRPDRD